MANYTKDDAMFKRYKKNGSGIMLTAAIERPSGGTLPLVNSIDIDWNDAELTYTYSHTNARITDSSDLLHLIDEISHGYSISWETYKGSQQTNGDNNGDNNGESPSLQEPE